MKKFSHLITLLPCYSLEDLPVDGSRAEAQSLLAAWTTLWHPQLIADAGKAPAWRSASDTVSSEAEGEQFREKYIHQHYYDDDAGGPEHPGDFEFDAEVFTDRWKDCLIVIPGLAAEQVFDGFEQTAVAAGAKVIRKFSTRSDLLSQLDIESEIDADLVNDFFALAYLGLQVELMTRKLRHSSDLDAERFDNTLLAAAQAANQGDVESAKEHLQTAFDQLMEEKNQYYPVAADLVDMVLLSDSIRPESIESELQSGTAKNFVATGSTIRHLAKNSPATIDKLKELDADDCVCFVVGPENELPDDLLSIETILGQLKQSLATFESVTGASPSVFMRRRAGLNASLPGILESLGFTGAVHATLDRGEVPHSYSSGVRWMGVDGGAVMATGATPLDAASDKSFLDLGVRIGGELDSAHVSTVFLARWPTQTCDSFEDLKNSTKYGSVLGDFSDASAYFENVYDPGYGDNYEADEYVGPWFDQAINSKSTEGSKSTRPISTFVDYWKNFYRLSAVRNILTMLANSGFEVDAELPGRLDEIQSRIELQTRDWFTEADASIETELDGLTDELGSRLSATTINTIPWKRSSHLVLPSGGESGNGKDGSAVKYAACNGDRCDAVVELSGFGQLMVHPSKSTTSSNASDAPAVDDGEATLRNELFEVRMDPQSGGIRGVYFYGKRGNLLSQRIAFRQVDPVTKEISYSKMVCDSFEVVRLSNIASEIRSSGRLLGPDEEVLVRFEQKVGLQRGRNVIDLEITLSEFSNDRLSTKNYIVNRVAWSEDSAELFCDIQGGRHPVRKPTVEAPHFVEVVQSENRFALLTHGLPWHRRASKKMLDSILVAGNEQRRSFRLGIAINPDSIVQQAIAEMHPRLIFDESTDSAKENQPDWLLHLANRNIVATWSQPVFDDGGKCTGIRIRFQETEDCAGTLKLYCRRKIESAIVESLDDTHLRDITLDSESGQKPSDYQVVETSFSGRAYFQLHLHWSEKSEEK